MVTPPLPPLYADLDFNSPLSDERAAALIDSLGDLDEARVVDLGCGWGELLLRILERWPTATGLGVDSDFRAIGHGQLLAQSRGLSDRVRFEGHDAASWRGEPADVVIVIGASHAWSGTPSEGPRLALAGMYELLTPHGRALYGEGVWTRTPTVEQLASMPITADELGTLPDLVDLAIAQNFVLRSISQASLDEWDSFESRHAGGYRTWLGAHANEPDAEAVRTQDAEHRKAWLRGWRETMGFVYLTLEA